MVDSGRGNSLSQLAEWLLMICGLEPTLFAGILLLRPSPAPLRPPLHPTISSCLYPRACIPGANDPPLTRSPVAQGGSPRSPVEEGLLNAWVWTYATLAIPTPSVLAH